MFRHKPLLPIDAEFGVYMPNVADVSSAKYVAKVQKWMTWAFHQVNTFNEKKIIHAKKCYDQNAQCSVLAPGDLVLAMCQSFQSEAQCLGPMGKCSQ